MTNKPQAMPIHEILNWFDYEIRFLELMIEEEKSKDVPQMTAVVGWHGAAIHLSKMKNKLTEATLEKLDNEDKE